MAEADAVKIEKRADAVIVTLLCERMDEASTQRLHAAVSEQAAASPTLPVILDFSSVSFVPSVSLGSLVTLYRDFKQRNQRLILTGLKSTLREALAITRLDKLFEIHEDPADALTAVRVASALPEGA